MSRILVTLCWCLLALLSGRMECRAVDLSPAAFDQANKLFDQGKYAEAAAAFQELLKSSNVATAIYFNLGNAWFKAGQIGRAVAAYHQAEHLAPRDPDLRANLQFARNQVQGPTLAPTRWHVFLGRLTLNEWTLLAAAAAWSWLAVLALTQLRPAWKPGLRNASIGLGAATVILGAGLAAAWQARSLPVAVVISKDAAVRQGPLDESPTVFTLHDGAEARILDRKDDWLQVTTDPKRIGWLKRDQVLQETGP